MCFTVHKRYPNPLVAKRDIVCYKTMFSSPGKEVFASMYRGFKYEIGKEYSLGKELRVRYETGDFTCVVYRDIREGFHSFSNKKELSDAASESYSRVKCIIPEGSTYYYNPDDREYVSDRIRIIEEI